MLLNCNIQCISDDRSTVYGLTPVSAIVFIKISRGNFPRQGPATGALPMRLRSTPVNSSKTECPDSNVTYVHCTYIHTYLPTYLPTYLHTCMHTCTHAYMHAYIYAYIHAYILYCYLPKGLFRNNDYITLFITNCNT